jgi:hypothetical protein
VHPNRAAREKRSLVGPKAAAVVRTLIDTAVPTGVRSIAARAETDPGNVSRLLRHLESEALVSRDSRGAVSHVDWQALLRAWTGSYGLMRTHDVRTYVAPRGLGRLEQDLARGAKSLPYVVTGALAAARFAPVAPTALVTLYVDDFEESAGRLGLERTDRGANVLLVVASGDFVTSGVDFVGGLRCAAPSQVAADLMTSPGRGPSAGEALLEWMGRNESAWRR